MRRTPRDPRRLRQPWLAPRPARPTRPARPAQPRGGTRAVPRAVPRVVRRVGPGVALVGLVWLLAGPACTHRVERAIVRPGAPTTLDGESPFLKAHLRSGHVYVLTDWSADSSALGVTGTGRLLDPNRVVVDSGRFTLPPDSVALFETNVVSGSPANSAITLLAGITATVAGLCLTNPKSCFGSCPTIYAPGSDGEMTLQAEAFSAAIAPALEATDIDMLLRTRPAGRELTLRVTNEALETHVIRHADILAVPRPTGGRVYLDPDGAFRHARHPAAPVRCAAPEGSCLEAVARADGVERLSRADSTDLAARETIEIEFAIPPAHGPAGTRGELGLVVTSRQTLLTTFLIYQALAYLGTDAGRWLAALEAGGEAASEAAEGVGRILGRIEVLIADGGGGWVVAGESGETGPLAADTRVVPLGTPAPPGAGAGADATEGGTLTVRLRLTRGLWRLDRLQLVVLGDPVSPVRIRPHAATRLPPATTDAPAPVLAGIERSGAAPLQALLDPAGTLVTLPGDAYELAYRLPEDPDRYELFVEARGYYLEWMRREWIAEENPLLAARLLLDPAAEMRRLAPAFKRVEPELETLFWNSRYVRR